MFATLAGAYPGTAAGSDPLALREVIADQLEAGLGVLCDGIVHKVRGSGDVGPIVAAWRRAEALARQLGESAGVPPPAVKACLEGPWSRALRESAPVGRASRASALGVAAGLAAREVRAAADALLAAGAPVVQVDESGLVAAEVERAVAWDRELIRETWLRVTEPLSGHLALAVLGGSIDALGPEVVFGPPFTSYLLDMIAGPEGWRLAALAPRERGLVVSVADARTDAPDDEPVMVWGARYAASLGGRGPGRVGLAPSAGLEGCSREVARRKLGALAEAARKAGLPPARLAAELDPRAVDARTAAMGAAPGDGR